MADKDETERRVYVLPADLMVRIRAFQTDQKLSSEVEAVRRLLTDALQSKDSIDNILIAVHSMFEQANNFREIVKRLLSDHILVKRIDIRDKELIFSLRNGDAASIDLEGNMQTGTESDEGYIRMNDSWRPPKASKETKSSGGWDLDDEIPF